MKLRDRLKQSAARLVYERAMSIERKDKKPTPAALATAEREIFGLIERRFSWPTQEEYARR